jgi:hypothetical protein
MRTSLLLASIGLLCLPIFGSNSAHAQATRTWVSGVGDDVNPCSRTAPCKTFAGAISKTAAGGEINCLDPGGYGAVTITKSITIDCAGTMGSVLACGTNGVNVNDSATGTPGTIRVTLRYLSINGCGNTIVPGFVGVNFTSGAQLNVENSRIFGFQSGSAMGIRFVPPAGVTAKLHVMDTVIANNGTAATNGGIFVQPVGSGTAQVNLTRVQLTTNSVGVRADGTGVTGQVRVSVRDSVAAGNTNTGFAAVSAGGLTRIQLASSTASGNATGLLTDGAQAGLILNGVTSTANNTGLEHLNSGQSFTAGNNHIRGNLVIDGVPLTLLPLN